MNMLASRGTWPSVEKGAGRNFMEFYQEKWKVLPVRRTNLRHRLGAECLERSSAQKDLSVLVGFWGFPA